MDEPAGPWNNHDIVNNYRPDMNEFEDLYREPHENAELSCKEVATARRMADCLSCLNFTVAEGVGGTGVVGVLDNGEGQCIMLRAEMDAHPIEEATALPHACKNMSLDFAGDQRRVMHAAGHDLHMASLLAAATLMRTAVSHWRGTLVVVFQPNSVRGEGAQAMVDGGLYEIAPVPDAIFGQHSGPLPAGHINITDGPSLMSLDTVGIELRCSLGYQANPQCNTNPVALASELLIALDQLADNNRAQAHTSLDRMILGRSAYPGQQGVDAIDLTVSVRTDDDSMRRRILEAIEPRVREVCASTGIQDPVLFAHQGTRAGHRERCQPRRGAPPVF